jgi:hypothetical protein
MGLVQKLLTDPRIEALVKPELAVRSLLMRSRSASFATRLFWDGFDRPAYAYGVYQAAMQARMLGIGAISVAELGVASGDGLVALERIAGEVEDVTGTEIAVYGFDTGTGMPPPRDNRDLPYAWRESFYGMDEAALRARLRRSELVIGDVAETAPAFAAADRPPLGWAAVDVDYHSSTVATFPIFDADESRLLPRTLLHFDDVIGDERELHSPFAGQLAAIEGFNRSREQRKLAKVHALRHKRIVDAPWHDQLFVLHCFDHSRYGDYVYDAERELPA